MEEHHQYVWWACFSTDIPMGKTCSPLLVDLFIYWYEADFILGLFNKSRKKLA
jgi:hypothetical protein